MVKKAYTIEFFYDTEEEYEKCCALAKALGGNCSFQVNVKVEGDFKCLGKAIFSEEHKLQTFIDSVLE